MSWAICKSWGEKALELTSKQDGCCVALWLWGRRWICEGAFPFLLCVFCSFTFGFGFFLCTAAIGQKVVPHCNVAALLDPGTVEHGQLRSSSFISCFECATMNHFIGGGVCVSHLSDKILSG